MTTRGSCVRKRMVQFLGASPQFFLAPEGSSELLPSVFVRRP